MKVYYSTDTDNPGPNSLNCRFVSEVSTLSDIIPIAQSDPANWSENGFRRQEKRVHQWELIPYSDDTERCQAGTICGVYLWERARNSKSNLTQVNQTKRALIVVDETVVYATAEEAIQS